MRPRDYVAAGAVAVALGGAFAVPPIGALRGLSLDTLFALRHAVYGSRHEASTSPSVVVAIDEETYRRPPFKDLPKVMWTKQIAAVMNAVIEGGAGVVGFDLILPTSVERYVRGFDREFLIALHRAAKAGKVVLAKVQHQLKPISPFRGYSFAVGHQKNIRPANVFEDDDGVIRRVPLLFRSADAGSGERIDTSLSLELAARGLGTRPEVGPDGSVRLGGYAVPSAGQSSMLINFDGGSNAIPAYSLSDLYACVRAGRAEYFREHFAGKVVFVGAVLDVEDRKITSKRWVTGPEGARPPQRCVLPVMKGLYRAKFARDTIPGVYIHAAAVNDLIRREALRRPPAAIDLAIGIAIALAAALGVMLLSPLVAGVAVVAGAIAWTGAATASFQGGLVLPLLDPLAGAVLTFGLLLGYRFTVADKDKRRLRNSFGLYLAPSVVDQLLDSGTPPALGGETRVLSAFFSDIASFTAISEELSPTRLVSFLNAYLSVISDTIEEHGGFVDKYIGDAVVGVFGAPMADPDHACRAVEAALASQARLERMQQEFDLPPGRPVRTRIGIASGEMLVGNIGSQRRFNYTVIGDTVNLAARLEGANKVYGTRILVGERTRQLAGDTVLFREIDRVRVVGREAPVTLFEPVGAASAVAPEVAERLAAFGAALASYRNGRWTEAATAFRDLAPSDPACRVFLERIGDEATAPPGWDGVTDLQDK